MTVGTVAAYAPDHVTELDRVRRLRLFRVDRLHTLALGLALLSLALLHSRLPYPVSGSDGGNWLGLSGGLIGIHANAASTVYPPALLILLAAIRGLISPVDALRVTALLVAILPGFACYTLLRTLRLGGLALFGIAFSLVGYSLEMLAWGGYPQLMGTGLAIFACAALLMAYRSGQDRYFVATGMLAGLAVMTHQLAGLQAMIAVAVTSFVVLLADRHMWQQRIRQWALAAIVFTAIVLPGVPVYVDLISRAGASAFNANAFTLGDSVGFVTNEAPALWLLAGTCVPLAVLLRGRQHAWPDVATLVGLAVASAGLALLTSEVRALYLGLMVSFISAAVVFADLVRASARNWTIALAVTGCALASMLIGAGLQRFEFATRYYAMLDAPMLEGLVWLALHARPDDLAVAMRALDKWPLGWWVQALGHVPSYVDHDPQWLYFREEKAQAAIASSILANDDPQRAAAEAQHYGVTLLIFDAREGGKVDTWLRSGGVYGPIGLVYTNRSLTIFRVDRINSSERL